MKMFLLARKWDGCHRCGVAVVCILSLVSCAKDPSTDPSPEVDILKLNTAFSQASQMTKIKSLVVARRGAIIKEEYYHTGGPDVKHDVRSITKSVMSLLVGIAIDQGYLRSVDQTLDIVLRGAVDSIPREKTTITIRHLLSMSSGIAGNELTDENEYTRWSSAPDQVRYILNRPVVNQPGQVFLYNSGVIHLLSVIQTEATGLWSNEFAQHNFFDSLEITACHWITDHQGYNNGGAGLSLTPRDMIKIGNLILNRGNHQRKRVVSSTWIDQSTETHILTNDAVPYGSGYGYGWWTGHAQEREIVFAMGWGGQFIVIVPSVELVVVATNEWQGLDSPTAGRQWQQTFDLIVQSIIPAFQ
jgi:CubicO group peptidase (beta-lactamase class C family)